MNRFGRYTAALRILTVLTFCIVPEALGAEGGALVPVGILRPAADAQGRILQAAAPDGKVYPVFRPAEDSPFIQHVRVVLETSFAQKEYKRQ